MSLDERDYMSEPKQFRGSGKSRTAGGARVRSPGRSTGAAPAWWNAAFPWLTGMVILLAIAVGIKWAMEQRQALPFPASGDALWFTEPSAPKLAMLRLAAPASSQKNFAVRLDDWTTGTPVVLIHVRAGEASATLLPLGRYKVSITKGTRWLGSAKLFGVNGEIQQSLHPLDFVRQGNQINGHRIELEVPFKGNMEVKRVWGQ